MNQVPSHYSRHALERQQERGIPPTVVDLILLYGVREKPKGEHGSLIRMILLKNSLKRIKAREGPHVADLISRYRHAYLVLRDSQIITVGYLTNNNREKGKVSVDAGLNRHRQKRTGTYNYSQKRRADQLSQSGLI